MTGLSPADCLQYSHFSFLAPLYNLLPPTGYLFSPDMKCTSIKTHPLMWSHKTAQIRGLYMKMLTSFLPLPANSLYQRMIEPDSPGRRAMSHTAASVPTFIREEYDRRFAFHRIGNEYVHLANIDTGIASGAFLRIKYHRPIWSSYIRKSIGFIPHHDTPPFMICTSLCMFCCELRNLPSVIPRSRLEVRPFL